jgi:predicted Zn-dependent protease
MGSSSIDDDGVRTREIVLVDHGILKTLLNSRAPVRGILHSSGSRHGWGATPSNLFVTSEKTLTDADLRKELLRRAKERGLDYDIVIRRVGGGSEAALMEMAKQMAQAGSSVSISEVFKLYADGHEEPLRGVHITELPAESFKEIVATGDTSSLFSDEVIPRVGSLFSMGTSEGGDLPVVTCVSPALLFEDVSLSKTEGPFPAKPITLSPLVEK